MKNLLKITALSLMAACCLAFTPQEQKKITIFTIGDSTCANKSLKKNAQERGWGQMLGAYLDSRYVVVDNHALNGRSSKSFRDEGHWQKVYDKIQPGDYVFIQFGHNDQKPKEDRHTDPGTTYNESLRQYVNATREKGGIPVLLTSMVRRKFDENGQLQETHGDYLQAVRDVAKEMDVILIDHNVSSRELVKSLGPEDSKRLYLWIEKDTNLAMPDGREDDTHLCVYGAKRMAWLILDEMSQKIPQLAPFVRHYDYVVAKDGSGDFFSVQDAIDAVPDFRKAARTRIYIRNGVYKEKLILPASKLNVTFIGEDVEKTVLTYDDYASKKNVFGEDKGTSGSSSFYVYGPDFHAENITFENSAGPVGQAVAIFVAGDKAAFRNCRFLGNQDTMYNWGRQSRQYYENCYIEGTVDFIFGSSVAYFKNCEIHAKRGGYLTAASTPEGNDYGYVFDHCRVTVDDEAAKVFLGRPWRQYAQTVFLYCELPAGIAPEGWNDWGKKNLNKTTCYAEYGCTGPGADTSKRVKWAQKLNAKKAARYSVDKVLAGEDGWTVPTEW